MVVPSKTTTLVTFMLQHPSARKVELLGSWDNFAEAYSMEKDRRRGGGHWTGCHSFRNIICDGEELNPASCRTGGLKMGGTYWYFYRIDGDDEFYDPAQLTTTTCPLMPGQTLNVLEVPFDVGRFATHSRSSSMLSINSQTGTMDPKSRFSNPVPKVKPRLSKLITSAEAASPPGHISSPRDSVSIVQRPHSAHATTSSSELGDRRRPSHRRIKSAPLSTYDFAAVIQAAFGPLAGLKDALTPSQGGRGRSRVLRSDRVRMGRSKSRNARELRLRDERAVEMRAQSAGSLFSYQRLGSAHASLRRLQEVEALEDIIDHFPATVDPSESPLNTERGRSIRPSHRRGFSSSFSARRSTSISKKREPSPLRNLLLTQEEVNAVNDLAIPSCVQETAFEDLRSPSLRSHPVEALRSPSLRSHPFSPALSSHPYSPTAQEILISWTPNWSSDPRVRLQEGELSPLSQFLIPQPLFTRDEVGDMERALDALHEDRTRVFSPWSLAFDVPLPESPEFSDHEHGSPTFSSIQGDVSEIYTPQRYPGQRDFTLPEASLSGFDFGFESGFGSFDSQPAEGLNMRFNFNESITSLSLKRSNTKSTTTTSTAMPYQLPDETPFATQKPTDPPVEGRDLTPMERLLDEFEYLGAALL